MGRMWDDRMDAAYDKLSLLSEEDQRGRDRLRKIAQWEREGKLTTFTFLGDYIGDTNTRTKTCIIKVGVANHRANRIKDYDPDAPIEMLRRTGYRYPDDPAFAEFVYDGRLPWPPEEVFARVALAVMAL